MSSHATRSDEKKCTRCSRWIDTIDYPTHLIRCSNSDHHNGNDRKSDSPSKSHRSSRNSSHNGETKKCPICNDFFIEKDYPEHMDGCDRSTRRKSPIRPAPSRRYDPDRDYRNSNESPRRRTTRRCRHCSRDISEDRYYDHSDRCQPRHRDPTPPPMEECIFCHKQIPSEDFKYHVERCAPPPAPPTPRKPKHTCFQCSHEITLDKDSSHTISCRFKHNYCIPCLEKKAQQHIQSNSIPVCHSDLCDYELSRYEAACLPINADLIERLLACVRTQQKPQCPICQYYVEFKTMNDYREHVGRCEIKETMFCESCHCPIVLTQLENHEKTCEKLPSRERLQKLVDFILPRTKYPLEVFQLRYFIEHQRADRFPIDPPSIVNALAQYGGSFPYDIPMMTCGLCGDNFIYDDIFVFGCDQSHKMCYPCFARSCDIKRRDNAIMTCDECAYQLTDGEIKQLRLSDEEVTAYREYQLQKIFSSYTTGTQGVIRCPNQGCKWVAEVANPDERFQVTCGLCQYQFCSICNGQYHFRTTCQEIPEITQRWFHWCQTGRENYWRTKAQQNDNFRTQLAEFERQRTDTAQRNEELRQRYDELVADENYKAQNCRACPNCGRVVQHLGGCDLMVCGRNYHGGDDQSGCGQGFRWSQARPYVPINTGPAQVQFDMIAPEQDEVIVHEGVQCDGCQQVVEGIRFDCLYCASLIFCEKCEQRRTLEHYEENQREGQRQHIFRLTARPA